SRPAVAHESGNLREVRNAIERAVILTRNEKIDESDLPHPEAASLSESASDDDTPIVPGGDITIEQLEEEHIRRVLSRASTLQKAAEILGIDQATLYRKRKKLEIN
ncbi:MAG: hypothetical protein MI807_24490, partial [Verrucomicrobiales bacterium]|nr:hypothetical protein [Verrucomicrobiales bacterium]